MASYYKSWRLYFQMICLLCNVFLLGRFLRDTNCTDSNHKLNAWHSCACPQLYQQLGSSFLDHFVILVLPAGLVLLLQIILVPLVFHSSQADVCNFKIFGNFNLYFYLLHCLCSVKCAKVLKFLVYCDMQTAEEAMTPIESTFSLDVNSRLDW